MEAAKYLERKGKADSITLQKLGPGTVQLIARRFDPESGNELPPEISLVKKEQLQQQLAALDEQTAKIAAARAGIAALLADVTALD